MSDTDELIREGRRIQAGDGSIDVPKWLQRAQDHMGKGEIHPTKERILSGLVDEIKDPKDTPPPNQNAAA